MPTWIVLVKSCAPPVKYGWFLCVSSSSYSSSSPFFPSSSSGSSPFPLFLLFLPPYSSSSSLPPLPLLLISLLLRCYQLSVYGCVCVFSKNIQKRHPHSKLADRVPHRGAGACFSQSHVQAQGFCSHQPPDHMASSRSMFAHHWLQQPLR